MRFALLGHPVGHSMSPVIHAAAFAALGLPYTYELIDAPSQAELALVIDAVRRGELDGANVTVPHKRAVLGLVDEVAPSASEVGAANVIVRGEGARLVAHNTDADALATDLAEALGYRPRIRAAVLGAGGAGLAAVAAAKKLGFSKVAVTTRSWPTPPAAAASPYAPALLSLGALLAPFPGASSRVASPLVDWLTWIEDVDLIVQATSSGMAGGGSPSGLEIAAAIPCRRLKGSALVYDVVYNPPVTALVREARACGLDAVGGLGMLVLQAALSFTLWTGAPAPLAAMRAAVGLA